MGRMKRDSKRRWIKRYNLWKWVPAIAIVEHNLTKENRLKPPFHHSPNIDALKKGRWTPACA